MCGRGCQFPRCWVSVSDGLPVGCAACGQFPRYPASGEGVAVVSVGGMVCLWIGGLWSVPSVLGVGRMVCHSSSGEGVGW